jgi:hypothetical protein
MSSLRETYNLVIIFNMYPPFFLNITMLDSDDMEYTEDAIDNMILEFSGD